MSEVMKHFNVVAEALYESARKVGALKAENNRLRQAIAEMEEQEQGEPATLEEIRKAMIFGIPLYTTPQQRKPLTDEEIRKFQHHMVSGAYQHSFIQGVRYAEAAHGIKE